MGVDLALVHMGDLALEGVLDRVFEGDDVVIALAVHFINERGERGALAAAHGAGDEDEAVVKLCEGLEGFRQAQLVHGAHAGVDDPKDHVVAEALLDDGGAIAARGRGVGKVHVAALFEALGLAGAEESEGQPFCIGGGDDIGVGPDFLQLPVAAPVWSRGGREVDV